MQTIQPDVDDRHRLDPPTIGEYEGFDIYPMPAFVRFSVPDPVATAQWYVDALGFGVMYVGPEVDGTATLVHLRRRKYQDILLVPGAPDPGSVHLDATGEMDALAERSSTHADHVGPVETPYGPRELPLEDPHGHRLVFFAAPEAPAGTIDEAMQQAADAMSG